MKKIYPLLFLSLLFLASCDLDREPETILTDNGFWQSETDLKGATIRLYNLLDGFHHDTRSDELVKTSSDNISNGSRLVPNTSDDWSAPYKAIFTANNIIKKAPQANVDEATLNRYIAEAKFFRAYNYFLLVKKYGDVPLMLNVITSTDDPLIQTPRSPREDVIQQCYKDLDYAALWLPRISDMPDEDWGRASHSAALALKERIGLYEGTYIKYHNLQSDYKSHLKIAIDAAEEIINENEHALYPDWQKLFTFDGEGRQNKENIFVKIYGPDGAGTVTHGNSRQMENSVSVTRRIVDQFLYSDGLPENKSPLHMEHESSFDDVFQNRDPRLGTTLYQIGEEAYKGPYIPFTNQHGYGYSLKKGFMIEEWETNSKETVDKMLIRYAEVLISYAEALYEYNGSITDEQLDLTVNALRQRAGFNIRLTNAFVTANGLNMRDEIRRERTVEFVDEGFRYDDIIRWKIAEDVLPANIIGAKFVDEETTVHRQDIANRLTDAEGNLDGAFRYNEPDMYVIEKAENRQFDPSKDYLYPIPQQEIILTKNAITQNPGWE